MNSQKHKIRWILLASIVTSLVCSGVSSATSLWNQNGGNFFGDHKAAQAGDLVTIIIVEQAQATQNASTQTSKNSEVGIGPGLGILTNVLPEISGSGEDSLSATGKTSRGGSLTAKVTVRVAEVLPDGNLYLQGTQQILINGENQEIKVSGIVRPQDIMADNTVLSTFVADANIVYLGDGPIGDRQTPGLLSKLFHWLF